MSDIRLLITSYIRLLIMSDIRMLIMSDIRMLITSDIRMLIMSDIRMLIMSDIRMLIMSDISDCALRTFLAAQSLQCTCKPNVSVPIVLLPLQARSLHKRHSMNVRSRLVLSPHVSSSERIFLLKFEVIKTVITKTAFLQNLKPCDLVKEYLRFRRSCSLQHKDRRSWRQQDLATITPDCMASHN